MDCTPLQELLSLHRNVGAEARERLDEFSKLWTNGNEEELYAELVFCILTPQSRATYCWSAVEEMRSKGLLFNGKPEEILGCLSRVRFKYKKSVFVSSSRDIFLREDAPCLRNVLSRFNSPEEARIWLAANVKGLGLKEASHFLRNIGLGKNLAILDRHILKNLVCLGVIEDIPASLTASRYICIETQMRVFAEKNDIAMGVLDLLLWYKEAGEIFK